MERNDGNTILNLGIYEQGRLFLHMYVYRELVGRYQLLQCYCLLLILVLISCFIVLPIIRNAYRFFRAKDLSARADIKHTQKDCRHLPQLVFFLFFDKPALSLSRQKFASKRHINCKDAPNLCLGQSISLYVLYKCMLREV